MRTSREIKFRAWDKDNSCWVPNEEIDFGVTHDGKILVQAGISGDWVMLEHHNLEVMLYTGLLDKNGKEIFEGDIVKGFSGDGVVEWFDNLNWDSGGSIHSGFWCKEWCEYKDPGALSYHDGFDDECEVIGNIYENGDLLK